MPDSYNITINQGADFFLRWQVTGTDGLASNLSGYSAQSHVKYRYSDTGILLNLAPVVHPSYISGFVDFTVSGSQTTGIPIVQGLYDAFITNGIITRQFLQGYVDLIPEVTP